MKEYIKKFESALAANNYAIVDIPFTTSVAPNSVYPLIDYIQNLVCNEENKKIVVDGQGNIRIVDVGPPNDEIWYTSSNEQVVTLYSCSGWPEFTNTYSNGKGIIKFKTDVTIIGNNVFKYCRNLTSVTIPNSVTSIGEDAFYDCGSLTSVTIGNGVTSIGKWAFDGCRSLTSVTIPNSVTSIGDRAFCGCGSLSSLSVESGNMVYDSRNNCNAIIETATNTLIFGSKNTTIPNTVTSIGDFAFYGFSSLTSIEIPDSVTNIGSNAFCNCDGLTSVTIGNSVTSIGYRAFYYCIGLISIEIPNSVTNIESDAFYGINNIIYYSGTATGSPWGAKCVNGYIDGYLVYGNNTKATLLGCSTAATGTIVIPNSVTGIGQRAFYNCSGLTSVTIGNSVTSIGSSAFFGCSGLTSVTIPNSVTSIGNRAFYVCSGLTSVAIGNSVTSIGTETFYNCSGLTSVTIGNNVTSIGNYAFRGCTGLTSVTIPNSVTSIGDEAFRGCSGLTSVTIPNSVTSIGSRAFQGCSGLTSVTIGNSVTSIGNSAFYDCSSLTSVTIPNSVTSIGEKAFYNCSSLTSVIIESDAIVSKTYTYGNNIKYIFGSQVKEYIIGNSVTNIGDYAFSGCYGLTSVTIPNSVVSIGSFAFSGCGDSEFYYTDISTQWHNTFDNVWDWNSFPFSGSIYIHCLGDNVDVYVEQPENPYCCFIAGTKVQLTNNVTKNIEDVQVGDSVISYNPTTDELYTTTVKNIIIHENTTTLARVTLANGSIVEMNEYHPILTKDGWHSITNYEGYDTLIIADEVKTIDGYSKIVNIERWINDPITTYTFDVVDTLGRDREYDNYFANNICVHNIPICGGGGTND